MLYFLFVLKTHNLVSAKATSLATSLGEPFHPASPEAATMKTLWHWQLPTRSGIAFIMNIHQASADELKSWIASLMIRYAAIAEHFGYVRYEGFTGEPLASHVPEVAELVELSRISQLALARLVEIERPNTAPHYASHALNYHSQFDNAASMSSQQLRLTFLQLMHQSGAQAHYVAEAFPKEMQTGLVSNDLFACADSSQLYAKYRTQLAEIHALSLDALLALTHLLHRHNQDKYRSGL